MTKEEFKEAGQRLCGRYGWQKELAERLGKRPETISRYTTGKTEVPRIVELALRGLESQR